MVISRHKPLAARASDLPGRNAVDIPFIRPGLLIAYSLWRLARRVATPKGLAPHRLLSARMRIRVNTHTDVF
jgi:hypothetical protein